MMNNSVEKEKRTVWRLTLTGLMSALGFVLMLIEIPIPFLIPEFVKFDFSEVPALIATYMLGPVEGIVVCLVKNLLKAVFMSSTGGIGELVPAQASSATSCSASPLCFLPESPSDG